MIRDQASMRQGWIFALIIHSMHAVVVAFLAAPASHRSSRTPLRCICRDKMSFVGKVQKTYTAEDLLLLGEQHRSTSTPQEAVRFLHRMVQLIPKGPSQAAASSKVRSDPRLTQFLDGLSVEKLAADDLAILLWSSAVLRRPLRQSEVPQEHLLDALDRAVDVLDMHRAAEVQWAWESLGRDSPSTTSWPPPPARLVKKTAPLPFAVRIGAMDTSLLSLDTLLAEASPQRDVIQSGSAVPTLQTLAERRLTAWQSDVDENFEYSGKAMPPRVGDEFRAGMTPTVAAVRDALAQPPIQRWYDSVLINYYEGGKVRMRIR